MIVLINPNATKTMTVDMAATAQTQASKITVEGWTSTEGPPSIQGPEDGAAAVPPMLKLVQQASDAGAKAIIIGCFDDTGLSEARMLATCPIIGIGQAAYHMAAISGGRFSVVTTLSVSVPILEANIRAYGLEGSLARVHASGIPVLEIENESEKLADKIKSVAREDDVNTVVLGCGGMTTALRDLQATSKLQIIDGVRSAAAIASGLV